MILGLPPPLQDEGQVATVSVAYKTFRWRALIEPLIRSAAAPMNRTGRGRPISRPTPTSQARHRKRLPRAYGCKEQTPHTFAQADIAELTALMARVPRNDSPPEGRKAIADAIASMERRVAPTVGTATDRPAAGLRRRGDRYNELSARTRASRAVAPSRHGTALHQGQSHTLDPLGGGD